MRTKRTTFQRDVINLTNLASYNRLVLSLFRNRNLSSPCYLDSSEATSHFSNVIHSPHLSYSFEERTVCSCTRKALIDRGIRLLTSNQRRIQLANNAQPRETQSSRLSLSRFAPRHYYNGE